MKQLVLVISFLFFSCSANINNISKPNSITHPHEPAGKWLVTITIGKWLTQEQVMPLRNQLVDVFSKEAGGLYHHAIDIDEYGPNKEKTSKAAILAEFEKLKSEIQAFKQANPGFKTMLIWGMLCHGHIKDNKYFCGFSDQDVSGDEIVDIVQSIGVDETLMFLQSCYGGGLVTNHFETNPLYGLASDIQDAALNKEVKIAVLTPVSKYIPSVVYVWENDILQPSFKDDATDLNQDGIVTYEEFKSSLLIKSCQYQTFVPSSAFEKFKDGLPWSGIDPQFFDRLMPGKIPLFLTNKGVEIYNKGLLSLPFYDHEPALVSETARNVCQYEEELYNALLAKEPEPILNKLETATGNDLLKILDNDKFAPTDREIDILKRIVEKTTDDNLKQILEKRIKDRSERLTYEKSHSNK